MSDDCLKVHMGHLGRPLCGAKGYLAVRPLALGGLPKGRRSCRRCLRVLAKMARKPRPHG